MGESLLAGSVALGLISVATIPAIKIVIKRFLSRRQNGYEEIEKLYEDEDGIATKTSQESFSRAASIYVLLGATFLGLGVSIATAIQSTVQSAKNQGIQDWLAVGSWVSSLRRSIHTICLPPSGPPAIPSRISIP